MPTNLQSRAEAQQGLFSALTDVVRSRLAAVHDELDRRDEHPELREPSEWQTAFGGTQHLQVARARLAANRADQVVVRAGLAAVETPAEAGPQGAALSDLLIAEAGVEVEVRAAEERVAIAGSLITSLGALLAACSTSSNAAAARVVWATHHQTDEQRLRDALTSVPLVSIVGDATALAGSATFDAADARLDELLPTELRTRATARLGDAGTALRDGAAQQATADDAVDELSAAARPGDAAVAATTTDLLAAERALDSYVGRSVGRLTAASASLARVIAHRDLETAQTDALDATGRADAVTAVGLETDLAAAFDAVAAARRDVDDAILAALAGDPDSDPETDADVVAARTILNGSALQDALTNARGAYDVAARRTLDEWEVEVPASVWESLADFVDSERTLDELGDQPTRDALVSAVDAATDALATALDAADVAERTALQLSRQQAERRAANVAIERTAPSRLVQYLRGHGAAGRTTVEI